MKIKLPILKILFLIFVLTGFFIVKPVWADQEMDDYSFQLETYQKVYEEFKLSRNKFLKYQVLSAREQVQEALKNILLQRNKVLKAYFLLLKSRLNNSSQDLNPLIDEKILFLDEKNEEIDGLETASLDELFSISDEIEEGEAEFDILAYKVVSEIILNRTRSLHQESVSLEKLIKEEIGKPEDSTESAKLNLWLKEVGVKNYLAEKEIEASELNLSNLKSSKGRSKMMVYFNDLKIDCQDAQGHLEQAVSFQKEILLKLK
ncbi:hypothetical protein COT75_01195 [Candidatus Beckwithbacteria bacterium CG10_big_fil_rev_8_21_14_0_10_34_10]|uniref:Uncharacterized protein n=1 Tax=Candidatus Beckwithbacteria bacterium CG10_big_fil_rev_8_21_14_0_10_34_10 TaxID=1974495 RepID=A0A2H0WA21_9BACT|nr:MAG: hypothetical protein COT75_01195 [Candidatus Beckwithbacteria bacterium CG10_big_fil_rev_8_21_14_0_10_34_10]